MLYQVALLSCSKAAPKCGDQKTENTAYSVWAVQWLPGEDTGSPQVLCKIVGPPAMTSSQWKCVQGNAVVCDWLLWSVAGWTVTLGVVLIQRAVIGAAVNPSRRHYNTSYWPKFKYRFFFDPAGGRPKCQATIWFSTFVLGAQKSLCPQITMETRNVKHTGLSSQRRRWRNGGD